MTELPKNIVVIPVRGGSKRLPGKNIRLLRGIPLLAHSILYAQLFPEIVSDVYVSTDDPDIEEIALEFGAKVINRPEHLAQDNTPTLPVLVDVLQQLNDPCIKNVILLQATNPLRERDLLTRAWSIYTDPARQLNSLFTVTRSFAKLGKIVADRYIPWNYQIGQRSQDLEKLYCEDGVLYISSAANLLASTPVLLDSDAYPLINDYLSVDIDTIEEFDHAVFLFDRYNINYHTTEE